MLVRSEVVGQRDTDVSEAPVDDVEVVAYVEGHHRTVVQTEGQWTGFQLETEAECADRSEEETVVTTVAVVEAYASTEATPELPSGELGCPVGPLLDVPVVHHLSGETLVDVEYTGRDVEEVLLAEVVLVFEVDGRTSEVCTDDVRCALCLCQAERADGHDDGCNGLSHVLLLLLLVGKCIIKVPQSKLFLTVLLFFSGKKIAEICS